MAAACLANNARTHETKKERKERKERKAEGKQKLTTLWHGNETASGLSGRRESQTGPPHRHVRKRRGKFAGKVAASQAEKEMGEQRKDNSNSALLPLFFCLMLHVKLSC